MKVTVDCSDDNELEIIIKCQKIDDNIKQIVSLFEDKPYLIGKLNERTYQIKIEDIYYLEANEDHIFIYCENEVYETNLRLYELENKLDNRYFIRISKSIILNLGKLASIKAYLNGRYEATLINNERVIITRHYVNDFKKKFGM